MTIGMEFVAPPVTAPLGVQVVLWSCSARVRIPDSPPVQEPNALPAMKHWNSEACWCEHGTRVSRIVSADQGLNLLQPLWN